jgi:hypothetical protein
MERDGRKIRIALTGSVLVLRNGRLVYADGTMVDGGLVCEGGTITEVLSGAGQAIEPGREEIDLEGRFVLPGAIDPHIQLHPVEDWGHYATETGSAALGGITTIAKMHRDLEGYDAGDFWAEVAGAESRAYVDFCFHRALMSDAQIAAIPHYARDFELTSFKLFMAYKGAEGYQIGIQGVEDGQLYDAFEAIAGVGGIALVGRLCEVVRLGLYGDAPACPLCSCQRLQALLRAHAERRRERSRPRSRETPPGGRPRPRRGGDGSPRRRGDRRVRSRRPARTPGSRGLGSRSADVAAGADAIFPEALLTPDEFRRIREELDVPLVIDVPEWGKTPAMTTSELEEWGFDLGIYAISAMRVALAAVRSFFGTLAAERTQRSCLDRMMTRAEVDELVGLPAIRADEERFEQLARGPLERDRVHRQLL